MVISCYCVAYAVRLQFKILWQGYTKNKKNLRFHRRVHRRTITRRYFTESWKTFTGVCHNHRRRHRRIITRWYFTESWKIFTRLCHNHRWNHLRCCRHILPTKSLTDYPHPEAHACQTRVRAAQVPTNFRTDRKVWRNFRTFLVRISINFRQYYRWNLMPPTTINVYR